MSFYDNSGAWIPSVYGVDAASALGHSEETQEDSSRAKAPVYVEDKAALIEKILDTQKAIAQNKIDYESEILESKELEKEIRTNTTVKQNGDCKAIQKRNDEIKQIQQEINDSKGLKEAQTEMDYFKRTSFSRGESLERLSIDDLEVMLSDSQLELKKADKDSDAALAEHYTGLISEYENLDHVSDQSKHEALLGELREELNSFLPESGPSEEPVDNSLLARLKRARSAKND